MKALRFVILMSVVLCAGSLYAGPPLPFHTLEGVGGAAFTPIAYLVNPAPPGQTLGKPSVAMAYVGAGEKNVNGIMFTETVGERLEFGFAADRFGMGSLPAAIVGVGGPAIQPDVWLYHFNLRAMFVEENTCVGGFAMPAITGGVHFKINDGVRQVNNTLGGALTTIGYRKPNGVDFTLTATKTIPEVIGNPLTLTAGVRESQGAQLGFVGFGDTYRATFEGSIGYMPRDRLLLLYEYRQKANPYTQIPGLIGDENDWHGFDLALILNDQTGLCVGYGIFGTLLNTQADGVWWLELKHEF